MKKKKALRKSEASFEKNLKLMNDAFDCCVNIEMLAELFKGIEITGAMHPSAFGRAGNFMINEMQKQRVVLDELARQLLKARRLD